MPEEIKISTAEKPHFPSVEKSPEMPATVESAPRPVEQVAQERSEPLAPVATPVDVSGQTVAAADATRVAEIERILEEDLSDLYFKLPDDKKAEFRKTGEDTARQIDVLLSAASVKVKKIVELIRRWLSLIPGINKFFLEQEAKIKTDHLLKMNGRR